MGMCNCVRAEVDTLETQRIKKDHVMDRIVEETKDTTRNRETLKIMATLMMPMICIIVMSISSLTAAIKTYGSSRTASETVVFSLKITTLINRLQKERGITSLYLSGDRTEKALNAVEQVRVDVDTALNDIRTFPPTFSLSLNKITFNNLNQFVGYLEDYRTQINSISATLEQNIYFYTNITKSLIDSITAYIVLPPGSDLWNRFVAFSSIQIAGDALGIQRALGSSFYAACFLSVSRRNWFVALNIEEQSNIEQTYKYFPEMKGSYNSKIAEMWPLIEALAKQKAEIAENNNEFCLNATAEQKTANGLNWFNGFTRYIEVIGIEANRVADEMVNGFDHSIKGVQTELALYSIAVITSCTVCVISSLAIYFMTGKVQTFAKQISAKALELETEKQRTNNLILEMLPKRVAEDLITGRGVASEFHPAVSVYFSDIVGFTTISATCTPDEVIRLLNILYSNFDSTIDHYDVYKVETIGDSYMVVAGLHKEHSTKHAFDIASMALEIRKNVMKVRIPYVPNGNIYLRAGIHSGPCAAGVVGTKMPRYCLFGDTVNTANRMESTGEALKIHISDDTKRALDDLEGNDGFVTDKRGILNIKGKGDMTTHWLICRKTESLYPEHEFAAINDEDILAKAEQIIQQKNLSNLNQDSTD